MSEKTGGGLVPYFAPMLAFLLLVNLGERVDQRYAMPMLFLRVGVPLGLLIYFRWRGAYTELKFRVSAMTLLDVAVGVALAVMWIAPYALISRLRPDMDTAAFDPSLAGAALVPLVLSLRMVGYAVVTPLMEELFMRSFLMRYVDVYDGDEDFRDQPIGKFSWRSFVVVVIVFLATHMMWEWWVMLPWAVLTNLWYYYRRDLFALVVVHAATNATILLAAIFGSHVLPDGEGGVLSLWFFV